jgi:hypothetical protein
MSSHDDNQELVEHQDEHNVIPNDAAPADTANEAAVSAVDDETDNNTEKKLPEVYLRGSFCLKVIVNQAHLICLLFT